MYQGELYKKSVEGPLLLCVSDDNIPKILFKVYNGWCYSHIGGRSLVLNIITIGFFWPTLSKDAMIPQVEGRVLVEFYEKYGIELRFSPIYYPRANGQVEVMNRIIFNKLYKNMVQTGANKGAWTEELPTVLWLLCTIPSHTTGESPFFPVYGTEAVLPVEVGLPSYRQRGFDEEKNSHWMRNSSTLQMS
ncbi:hypothetical protein LIER_36186 [Lithospermum erythrorhizon]|uniref:Integrase catalytic domain-containing protein n=1 Tax=Lithospermum erythrorhizon TaxID=34254 RepID=A0AAV3P2H3_LITER